MPKLKTHTGAKKRFKVTGGGKIKRRKAYKSHSSNRQICKEDKRTQASDFGFR